MNTGKRYSPEVRERAVQMVLEHQGEHGWQCAAIGSIGAKIGCTRETLRRWVRQADPDHLQRQGGALSYGPGQPAVQADRPNALWVSDFTYVSTWQGFMYVAFVI